MSKTILVKLIHIALQAPVMFFQCFGTLQARRLLQSLPKMFQKYSLTNDVEPIGE